MDVTYTSAPANGGGLCGGETFTRTIDAVKNGNTIQGTWNGAYGNSSITLNYSASATPPTTVKLNGGTQTPANPAVGEPITVATGNVFDAIRDYTTVGINPLSFTRYYNSMADTNTTAVSFGQNWRSTFDRYLRFTTANSAASIVAERADGQELIYSNTYTGWVSDSDVDVQLVQSGSFWILTDSDDTVETYNAVGQLLSIQARDGYTQMLSYNGNNQLATVSDSFNRQLQFTYQSNLLNTVTAPNGLVLTYGYGSSGLRPGVLDRLTLVGYSTSPPTRQTYLYENASLPFALTGVIDENTNRINTWAYNAAGEATMSEMGDDANLTHIGYNADGSRDVTNALGLVTVYKFTTLQGVPKVTEIDRLASATTPAATMYQTYDTNGYINNISDWNANLTTMVNDIHDQPLTLNEAVGSPVARTTTATYLTSFHLPLQIVVPNKTTTFVYDPNGNMLSRTETDTRTATVPYSTQGNTRTWTNTFDNFGHLLTATGPRTDVIATCTNKYDTSNNLVAVFDPLGHLTRYTNYNGSGLPLMKIDPNGVTNVFAYDVRDRLLMQATLGHSGNATNLFGYDNAGQLISVTRPDGTALFYQYDAAHRLFSTTNLLGESITYLRDPAGNITNQTVRNASGVITKTENATFDGLSRMLTHVGGEGQLTSFAYDGNGNRTVGTDGLTNSTRMLFDALNRDMFSTDPLTNLTTFGFDAQDNLTNVVDPRTLSTTYIYDGFAREIEESSPDKGVTEFGLDLADNRTVEYDARDYYTYRTFDKLNRRVAEYFTQSTGENSTNVYDATNNGNFGVGRLTSYTDESGSTTLTYNERGDVIVNSMVISGQPYTINYGYDLADSLTNIVYPSGHIFSYARDSQGRIRSIAYRPSTGGTLTMLVSGVVYAPFGPMLSLMYGNSLLRTNSYDSDYRLTGITTSSGNTSIQNLGLFYDNANNIRVISDNLDATRSQAFSYDADYRLKQASGVYGTDSYTYDADGNRMTGTEVAKTQYTYSSTANWLFTTTTAGIARNLFYYNNGNLAQVTQAGMPTNSFLYYARNRYNYYAVGGTNIAFYSYNTLGERALKTVLSGTYHYQYDEKGHLIAESQGNGALIHEYIWLDDMPIAQIEGSGAIYYIHPDHLNRPQKITDGNRNIVWDNEQQPFGNPVPQRLAASLGSGKQLRLTMNGAPNSYFIVQSATNLNQKVWASVASNSIPFSFMQPVASTNRMQFYRGLLASSTATVTLTNNLRFPGQYFDAESGLNYNMMRDYDPTLGRYIQNDPIGLNGGINYYLYSFANPVAIFDAAGLSCNNNDSFDDLDNSKDSFDYSIPQTKTPFSKYRLLMTAEFYLPLDVYNCAQFALGGNGWVQPVSGLDPLYDLLNNDTGADILYKSYHYLGQSNDQLQMGDVAVVVNMNEKSYLEHFGVVTGFTSNGDPIIESKWGQGPIHISSPGTLMQQYGGNGGSLQYYRHN